MYKVNLRKNNKIKRKMRVRKKIFGTKQRPRLSVFRSNKHIYGQIINDASGITLVSASDLVDEQGLKDMAKTEKAFEVGKRLAKKALAKDIKKVVFDKGCYRYHGRVKSLAEGAREGGLSF